MSTFPGVDVVTLGETMGLLHADTVGSLAQVSSLALGIGGAESNVAVGLARLGASVAWIGRVGQDSLGDRVERELRAEGVVVRVARDAGAPTGLMLKERRTTAVTRVLYYRAGSAGSRLSPEDVPGDLVAASRVLHVTGITPALSGTARSAVMHAIEVARRNGTLVSFDVNHRSRLWTDPAEATSTYREIAALSDIVFAGLDEAALIVGHLPSVGETLRAIAELGPGTVVLKDGAEGCTALIDGRPYRQAAFDVQVMDSVGAGDAFVAGYLAELVAGASPSQRLATAAATGAFACTVAGDWEGAPRRDELALLTGGGDPVRR